MSPSITSLFLLTTIQIQIFCGVLHQNRAKIVSDMQPSSLWKKKAKSNSQDPKATVRTGATFVALMPNLKVFNLLLFCYAAKKPIQLAFCFKIMI